MQRQTFELPAILKGGKSRRVLMPASLPLLGVAWAGVLLPGHIKVKKVR